MSKKYEDIDNENLNVAEMIRQDSTKIEKCASNMRLAVIIFTILAISCFASALC